MKYPEVLLTEMKLRAFSPKTTGSYLSWNSRFLSAVKKEPKAVTQSDISFFLVSLADDGLKETTRHQAAAALQFYYCGVLKRKFVVVYPKIPKRLTRVLSREEVFRMIERTENPRHRLLIELLYSSGLRVSEAVRLRAGDVLFDERVLFIRQGKGKKDRKTILSEKVIGHLAEYAQFVPGSPETLLFPSLRGGHLTVRAAQAIVSSAAKRAGILRKVHPHMLRSSFATHLIDENVDIHAVQKLLGHANVSTTQGYIRSSSAQLGGIKSPYDSLKVVRREEPR